MWEQQKKKWTTSFNLILITLKIIIIQHQSSVPNPSFEFVTFFAFTTQSYSYLSIYLFIEYDHYTRECEFGILKKENKTRMQKHNKNKKIQLSFWLNEEYHKLLSSLGIDHWWGKTISLWNSSGKNDFFGASLYVWYLQYWALSDALVDFKLWAGVLYLSFAIDTAPKCILWKRSKEDRSLRASRDGHSSSSSISPTLLVFPHLLQVQWHNDNLLELHPIFLQFNGNSMCNS